MSRVFHLFLSLAITGAWAASGQKPCGLSLVGMSHLQLQDTYMREIHLSDYAVSRPLWDATLYRPLQRYVQEVSRHVAGDNIHLVYVGVGPEAPLFSIAGSEITFAQRVGKLTLIDISEESLKKSSALLRERFPSMEIETRVGDITDGAASRFTQFLAQAVTASASLSEVAHQLAPERAMAEVFASQGANPSSESLAADIVYSEMVATFTGTAAMVAFESELRRKFPFTDETQTQFDEALKRAFECWQAYNDRAYQIQLQWMARLAGPKGIVAVATDTEKRFVDPGESSIFSFTTSSFPEASPNSALQVLPLSMDEVMWEDSQHTVQDETLTRALLPHRHVIHFGTYRGRGK